MSGGCGGEDFDLWRGLRRMRQQAAAPTLQEAERMRETDTREELHGRLMGLAVAVIAYMATILFDW